MRQPRAAADGRIVADDGRSAEDGGPGIDNHVVLHRRVTLDLGELLL